MLYGVLEGLFLMRHELSIDSFPELVDQYTRKQVQNPKAQKGMRRPSYSTVPYSNQSNK